MVVPAGTGLGSPYRDERGDDRNFMARCLRIGQRVREIRRNGLLAEGNEHMARLRIDNGITRIGLGRTMEEAGQSACSSEECASDTQC